MGWLMALVLNGVDQYAYGNAIAFAYPMLFVGWIYKASGNNSFVLNSGQSGTTQNRNSLNVNASNLPGAQSESTLSQVSATASAISTGTWQHVAAVWITDSSRYAYSNGTRGTQNTATRTTAAPNTLSVGRRPDGAVYLADKIAYLAVYAPTDLSDADSVVTSLQTNAPNLVQPAKLLHHWKLVSDATDSVGGNNLTTVGSPSFDADRPSITDGAVVPLLMAHHLLLSV